MFDSYYLYCDAAGGKDHGFIVVSGYLATFRRWGSFIEEWNRDLLASFDVPYFHMKEFAHSKGPFVSWKDDEARRAIFIGRAANIIARHVQRGFSCIVSDDIFNKVNKDYCLRESVGVPYSLAGRTCVARSSRSIGRHVDTHYVFEEGDEGKGDLMRVMEEHGYPLPIFRPSRDRVNKAGQMVRGVVPLQAADFAAYEMRKAFKDDPTESWPLHKYRKSLRALANIVSEEEDWGRYKESDLMQLCKKGDIPLRSGVAV